MACFISWFARHGLLYKLVCQAWPSSVIAWFPTLSCSCQPVCPFLGTRPVFSMVYVTLVNYNIGRNILASLVFIKQEECACETLLEMYNRHFHIDHILCTLAISVIYNLNKCEYKIQNRIYLITLSNTMIFYAQNAMPSPCPTHWQSPRPP